MTNDQQSTSVGQTAPPGWYPNPADAAGIERWWTGQSWSEYTRSLGTTELPAQIATTTHDSIAETTTIAPAPESRGETDDSATGSTSSDSSGDTSPADGTETVAEQPTDSDTPTDEAGDGAASDEDSSDKVDSDAERLTDHAEQESGDTDSGGPTEHTDPDASPDSAASPNDTRSDSDTSENGDGGVDGDAEPDGEDHSTHADSSAAMGSEEGDSDHRASDDQAGDDQAGESRAGGSAGGWLASFIPPARTNQDDTAQLSAAPASNAEPDANPSPADPSSTGPSPTTSTTVAASVTNPPQITASSSPMSNSVPTAPVEPGHVESGQTKPVAAPSGFIPSAQTGHDEPAHATTANRVASTNPTSRLAAMADDSVSGWSRNVAAAPWLLPVALTLGLITFSLIVFASAVSTLAWFGAASPEAKEASDAAWSGGTAIGILALGCLVFGGLAVMAYAISGDSMAPHARTHLATALNFTATVVVMDTYWEISSAGFALSVPFTVLAAVGVVTAVLYWNGRDPGGSVGRWIWTAVILGTGLLSPIDAFYDVIFLLLGIALFIVIPCYNFGRARVGLPSKLLCFPAIPFLSER